MEDRLRLCGLWKEGKDRAVDGLLSVVFALISGIFLLYLNNLLFGY